MDLAIQEAPIPKFIAVEGPIGVGKTTLAHKIAQSFNYDVFLEKPAENPFLNSFYKNPSQSALAAQLFFLFQRMQQIEDLKQQSLFEPVRVADFLIEKDRLFAEVTLSDEELALYDKVYEHTTIDAPSPDLVICLLLRATQALSVLLVMASCRRKAAEATTRALLLCQSQKIL